MIDSKGIIELEGMEFHSFHGVLEREKVTGNLFVVDFQLHQHDLHRWILG